MIKQALKLEQHLSQKQLLGLKVLQMNCVDLESYIREEAACNPLIDLVDDEPDFIIVNGEDSPYDEYAKATTYKTSETISDDSFGWIDPFAETLERSLLEQLYYLSLTDEQQRILRYLIANLDESGYFRSDLKRTARQLSVSIEAVRDALSRLQSLDPPGIGASCLEECLALQLKRINAMPCAISIVRQHLPQLAKRKYDAIAAALSLPVSEVQEACKLIASLDPKPGSRFLSASAVEYATPDVICSCKDNSIQVHTRFQGREPFSINTYYQALWKETDDKEVKAYLTERMKKANDLLQGIHDRESTLLRCSKLLIEKQAGYLFGSTPRAPLTMTQASELLGVHVSTVSRCVQGKYMQGPKGTLPLSALFCLPVNNTFPSASTDEIRQRILALIRSENRQKPLSDQAIVNIFEQQGISLSRRVITKYRQAMGIPTAYERRT